MPEAAADLLCRLLELMAMASGSEGIPLSEAEARFDRSSDELLDDLQLVVTREDYHPAGWVDDIRIEIEQTGSARPESRAAGRRRVVARERAE